MRFKIGDMCAQCPACNADEFYPALALSAGRRDVYICAACGHEIYFPELVARLHRERNAAPDNH